MLHSLYAVSAVAALTTVSASPALLHKFAATSLFCFSKDLSVFSTTSSFGGHKGYVRYFHFIYFPWNYFRSSQTFVICFLGFSGESFTGFRDLSLSPPHVPVMPNHFTLRHGFVSVYGERGSILAKIDSHRTFLLDSGLGVLGTHCFSLVVRQKNR